MHFLVKEETMEFNDRLKELRKNKNLTQQELADKIGVNRMTYRNYESGANEPKFRTLLELAKIFNVTTDYLLGTVDENDLENNHKDKINQIFRELEEGSDEFNLLLDKCIYKLLAMVEYNNASPEEIGQTLKDIMDNQRIVYLIDIERFVENMISRWSSFDSDKEKLLNIIKNLK